MTRTPDRLCIMVSKKVQTALDDKSNKAFRKLFLTIVEEAIEFKKWDLITTNSKWVYDRFEGLWTHPPLHGKHTAVDNCRYLWSCDYVLSFWAGGSMFQEVLEAAHRMKKKNKLYVCDIDSGTIERTPIRA